MTEEDTRVSEFLEHAVERLDVGPAPVAALVADAARIRRRRTAGAVLGSVAAVLVVVATTSVVFNQNAATDRAPSVASTSQGAVEPGMRLVGFGHVAIAVPQSWATNAISCGTSLEDSVVVDVVLRDYCGAARPKGVESVELIQGEPRFDFQGDRSQRIDGLDAVRQNTTCETTPVGRVEVCHGTVHIPSVGISFRAESSTGPSQVDEILSRIRSVPDLGGVPGFGSIFLQDQENDGDAYLGLLQDLGLEGDLQPKLMPGMEPGRVLGVTPTPGTMLEPGSVVAVSVVAEPRGPADEVSVGLAYREGGADEELADSQIRAGAQVTLNVGEQIWAFGHGKRSGSIAGDLRGTSLRADDWRQSPDRPRSWVAHSRGRSTITLYITADGRRVVLGNVTVVVR